MQAQLQDTHKNVPYSIIREDYELIWDEPFAQRTRAQDQFLGDSKRDQVVQRLLSIFCWVHKRATYSIHRILVQQPSSPHPCGVVSFRTLFDIICIF